MRRFYRRIKAAFYLRTINNGHIFIDGNKRTSMAVVERFLDKNNCHFDLKTQELEDYALFVANQKPSLEDVALWIQNHSK